MEKELNCPRCNTRMEYSGMYHFHEGKRYGIFGNLGELFVRKKSFNIQECPQCNYAEFYVANKV